MTESFKAGYSMHEIAAAYSRPPEWVRKTIVERMGKDVLVDTMRTRAKNTDYIQPEKLEESDYDNTDDSR